VGADAERRALERVRERRLGGPIAVPQLLHQLRRVRRKERQHLALSAASPRVNAARMDEIDDRLGGGELLLYTGCYGRHAPKRAQIITGPGGIWLTLR
jgi:hypothetical protein